MACLMLSAMPTAYALSSLASLDGLRGYYEGTDRAGHAFHVETLGAVGPFPLQACWSSDGLGRSRPLGRGWRIPFLEARIAPLSNHLLEMTQPNGVACFVKRDPRKPESLFCGKAWKGVEKGDEISLSADLGSPAGKVTLTFQKGRLAHIRTKDAQYNFVFSDRAVQKVTSGGRTLLQVVADKADPRRVAFVFDGGKTRTTCICGDALALPGTEAQPGGLPPYALARIVAPDGAERAFRYGMDGQDAVFSFPEGSMKWNPYQGRIVACGDWTYKVEAPRPDWNNPAIERIHRDGRREAFHFNLMNGSGRRLNADGTELKWQKFPSGSLYGLVRWKELFRGKESLERIEYSYDGAGHLIFSRYFRGDGTPSADGRPGVEEQWFSPDGKVVRTRIDGKVVSP